MWHPNIPGEYLVMQTHSGATTNKLTYQVMSRPFATKQEAENWAGYIARCESRKGKTVFVVKMTDIVVEAT